MDKLVLHLCPDDKFINQAVEQFEAVAPGKHEYVIYNRTGPETVLYIKKLNRFTFAPLGSPRYKQVIDNCKNGVYSALVMHSMPSCAWEVMSAARGRMRTAILTWGHEIYGLLQYKDALEQTQKLIRGRGHKCAVLKLRERFRSVRLVLMSIEK